jgi:hypothetical protein
VVSSSSSTEIVRISELSKSLKGASPSEGSHTASEIRRLVEAPPSVLPERERDETAI